MSQVARAAQSGMLLALSALGSACQTEIPGEVVGTFKITVALRENNCGAAAVYTNDGRKYAVEIREDSSKNKAYWHVPKDPPLQGTFAGDHFQFMMQSIVASQTTDAGVAGCVLGQAEVLEGAFMREASDAGADDENDAGSDGDAGETADAGAADAGLKHALEATHTLTIAPATSASCASAMLPNGPFEKFPCTVVYDLTGTRRGPL